MAGMRRLSRRRWLLIQFGCGCERFAGRRYASAFGEDDQLNSRHRPASAQSLIPGKAANLVGENRGSRNGRPGKGTRAHFLLTEGIVLYVDHPARLFFCCAPVSQDQILSGANFHGQSDEGTVSIHHLHKGVFLQRRFVFHFSANKNRNPQYHPLRSPGIDTRRARAL